MTTTTTTTREPTTTTLSNSILNDEHHRIIYNNHRFSKTNRRFIHSGSISVLPEITKKYSSYMKLYSWHYYYHTDEPDSKYII